MVDPTSPDGWLSLASQHEVIARFACEKKKVASQAYFNAGLAVECALKAYIMRRERFNIWPDRKARPDLYTHDLRELVRLAGIDASTSNPIAPALRLVMQWDRNQGYDPKPMPRRVAKDWVEAAFGPEGVVTWIRATLA